MSLVPLWGSGQHPWIGDDGEVRRDGRMFCSIGRRIFCQCQNCFGLWSGFLPLLSTSDRTLQFRSVVTKLSSAGFQSTMTRAASFHLMSSRGTHFLSWAWSGWAKWKHCILEPCVQVDFGPISVNLGAKGKWACNMVKHSNLNVPPDRTAHAAASQRVLQCMNVLWHAC